LIVGWKITEVVEEQNYFFIEPINENKGNKEKLIPKKNITPDENLKLVRWGFYYLPYINLDIYRWGTYFNFNETISIFRMRQIDFLEHDFKADVSNLRELGKKLQLPW